MTNTLLKAQRVERVHVQLSLGGTTDQALDWTGHDVPLVTVNEGDTLTIRVKDGVATVEWTER